MPEEKTYRVFAGHPKASLVRNQYVFGEFCRLLGLKAVWPKQVQSIKAFLEKHDHVDFIFYKSAWYGAIDVRVEGVHLFRDPRDMLISGYFSSMYSHPAEDHLNLAKHRARILELPKEAGLLAQIDYMMWIFDDMRDWNFNDARFYNMRFEDMYASEEQTIKHTKVMVSALNMILTDKEVEDVCGRYTFENLAGGRKKGVEDQGHHFRKGVSGDWKNHWNSELDAVFMERYGDLVKAYGYSGGGS